MSENLLVLLNFLLFFLFWITVILLIIRQNRLQRQIRDKQELLSIASHELSTPLTHIKGTLALVSKEPKVSPETQSFVARALKSVDQLSHLIDDLLTVSKFEMGKVKINPQPLVLTDVLDEVVDQFRSEAAASGAELKIVNQNNQLPKVLADADRIREVINNFLSNALKYGISSPTPISRHAEEFVPKHLNSRDPCLRRQASVRVPQDDSQLPAIAVSAYQKDGEVVVSVSDLGMGIGKKDIPKLFHRFVRLQEPGGSNGRRGAGLGLYISRLIIEAHKGRIWVESEPGRGSRFCFSLPTI